MRKYRTIFLYFVLISFPVVLCAQMKSTSIRIDTTATTIKTCESLHYAKSVLGISKAIDLSISDSIIGDRVGQNHYKYDLFYQGIGIDRAKIMVHTYQDIVVMINGNYCSDISIGTTPYINEKEAIEFALDYVDAKQYIWEKPQEEKWLQEETGDSTATFYPKGEIVICQNSQSQHDESFRLAYRYNIYASEPLRREYVYVDATNGEIISVKPIIKYVTGNAETRYSGTKQISTDYFAGSYRLRDISSGRGNGIITYNLQNTDNYSSAIDFTDNDNSWTSAEYNNSAKDDGALDAHWAAMMTYDYFLNLHERNSYDNSGATIKSYIHYRTNSESAFWNGSAMVFGDGNLRFDILTSLDVVAHEFGHGICDHTADLDYEKESGAINESLSDIWGACVENFATTDKDTWLIAEDIDIRTGHIALRSLSNPKIENQPDTYGGTFWYDISGCTPYYSNDYCGVHTNSGVMNYWFYLLATGGSGTNDNSDLYDVNGIGIDAAAGIVYRAETCYMSYNDNYLDAFNHTTQSAIDLYGEESIEHYSVLKAWHAVGVGNCADEYLINQNITTPVTKSACFFYLENVSVVDNSSLELESNFETIIEGPFIVETGSALKLTNPL